MHVYTDHFSEETRLGIGARIWRRKPDLRVHFAISGLNAGVTPAHTAIQYRRGTSRTGELNGGKEANGG
jgi:hypothetical protein